MKSILPLLLLLLAFSTYADEPKWVKDISKGCNQKTELCAVGTAVSRTRAEKFARVALAKIFENEISSNFKSKLSSSGGQTFEEMSEEISESTQLAMEGLEIEKIYEDKLNYYALAVLNKKKMARGLKKEIDKLDEKMQVYLKDESASSKVKLEKNFIKRESLSKSYEFLTGRELPSPVSFNQVFKAKKDVIGNTVVHVYLEENEPKSVEAMMSRLLSEAGYKTTTGRVRNKKSTHIVTGEITADKQYMNVEGFEKYNITLKLSAQKNDSVETGHLTYSTTEIGRNFEQAYNKALVNIKTYLNENITALNIE